MMIQPMSDDTPYRPGDDTADPTDDTSLAANLPEISAPLMSSVSYASSKIRFSNNVFPSAILSM